MNYRHIPTRIREWWNLRTGVELLETSFQAVIALATITYVTVALFQWCAMRQANETNREALTSVQRAYVVYTGLSTFVYFDVRNKRAPTVLINPIWENTGKTPTKNLRIYVSAPKEITIPYKASDLNFRKETDVTYTELYIAPGLTVHGGGRTLSLDDLHAIRDGKKQMYMWGCAWYDDVFPKTAHHVTEFCDVIDGAYFDPKDDTKPTAVTTDFCPVHNCADEECADKCE